MDVAMVWKESIIAPMAKVPSPKGLNVYWPVALTSLVMKELEKIVKRILVMSQSVTDPL